MLKHADEEVAKRTCDEAALRLDLHIDMVRPPLVRLMDWPAK
jgi:hypothetical protein